MSPVLVDARHRILAKVDALRAELGQWPDPSLEILLKSGVLDGLIVTVRKAGRVAGVADLSVVDAIEIGMRALGKARAKAKAVRR